MKCVCPMGGDRTCPDDCPLAVWQTLSKKDRKAQRKPIAERLYKEGHTMEAIATQLGVSQQQISKDLFDLQPSSKSKRAKTASNPKGAGRPKGKRSAPKRDKVQEEVNAIVRAGEPVNRKELGEKYGVSEDVIQDATLIATGITRAEPQVRPEDLSLTAQEKLAVAKRLQEHHLNAEHAARMRKLDEEVRQRVLKESEEHLAMLEEARIKASEDEKWYRELINNHKPPFTIEDFKTILMCLHPDGERTPEKLNEAFRLFNSRKYQLTGERPVRRVA